MKLHLRWQILLALVGLLLVLSILAKQGLGNQGLGNQGLGNQGLGNQGLGNQGPGNQGLGNQGPGNEELASQTPSAISLPVQGQTTGDPATSCTTRVPIAGGVFSEGMVGAPHLINPLLSDPNPVDRELVNLLFDGLTQLGADGRLQPALAEKWSVSEDGRTVQFTLREDALWHDGTAVTAADVLFTYGLMQQEAFPGSPALKTLWQSLTINEIDEQTIEFVLAEPYAPFLEATTRGILPAHLLENVSASEMADPAHPFNQSPIGSGPWQVQPDQNWASSNRLQLMPNPQFWPDGTIIPTLEFRFYPDENSLLTALESGEVTAVSHVTPTMLPKAATLADVRLFTAVAPRYTELLFNLADPSLTQTLELRQALAYALDRQAVINTILAGQSVLFEGPFLPSSWAYNPTQLTSYTYDPITATARLDATGWTVAEGQPVRQNGETPLTIRLLTLDSEPYLSLATAIQEQWTAVNISTIISTTATTADLREALNAGQFDAALVDIAPPADPDLYDFWSQEALIHGQNYARWNNRRASEALESARQLWNEAERRPYYDTFLRLFDSSLPALTLFQHTNTYALSRHIAGAEVGYLLSPRDRYQTFANWSLLYQEVAASCPATPSP